MESINQFVGRVEQWFKRLRALYAERYDQSQLKERIFQGMHPHLWDSMWFLYMKDNVAYEELLAAVYEAENEGTEGKVVNMKAKAMMVEKVIEEREKDELKDLKWQIESLTTIIKSATIGTGKTKGREGTSSPRKKELLGNSHKIECKGHLRKARYPWDQAKNLFSVFDVRAGVMDGMSVQLRKTSIGENWWELGFSWCLEILAPLLHKPKVKINDL